MKKMFVWIGGAFLVVVSVAIVMSAVSRKEDQIREDALYIDNMGQFSNGEGFYYLNQENFLQFYDYKSNQNTIVCNKPNCEHKPWQEETPTEQRCNAYISSCHSLFTYGEKLYLVETAPKKETLRIVQSNLDRSSQSVFAALNSEYIGGYVIKDDKLYFATLTGQMEKDESGMPVQTGISEVTMCSLDMRDGRVEEMVAMEQHYNAQLSILGIEGNRIYCLYGYFEERFTGLNYEEAQARLRWYVFDVETREMKETFQELTDIDINLCKIADHGIYYGKWTDRDSETSDLYRFDLETQENKKIVSDSHEFEIFDRKVIAREHEGNQCILYDMDSGETRSMEQQEREVSILGEYEDEFIVASYEGGVATYGHMKKAQYYKGNTDFESF